MSAVELGWKAPASKVPKIPTSNVWPGMQLARHATEPVEQGRLLTESLEQSRLSRAG